MRRLALPGALALLIAVAAPALAADPSWTATLSGPGPTGSVTVTLASGAGVVRWDLQGLKSNSLLTVEVRGGTCASPRGLVLLTHWQSRFTGGKSVQERTLTSVWARFFSRNAASRGGDVVIVSDGGARECVAFTAG